MGDVTRRFRAAGTIPYALALLVLTEYARSSADGGFVFGPVGSVGAIMDNGLAVSGSEAVVDSVTQVLKREVPGLHAVGA